MLIFEHGGLYNLEGELATDVGAVDIPEADYPQMANLNGCVAYLRARIKE